MSRVGRIPIRIPEGVEVKVSGSTVVATGPKGVSRLELPGAVTACVRDWRLHVERSDDTPGSKSLHGLSRALVNNMVIGVSLGFSKELHIQGVGYRARLASPRVLELSLGYSHTVSVTAPEEIEFEVPQPTQIVVKGIDKQLVGQVAADIRKWRKPEPYKGKGIRYAGESVRRKAGKAAK